MRLEVEFPANLDWKLSDHFNDRRLQAEVIAHCVAQTGCVPGAVRWDYAGYSVIARYVPGVPVKFSRLSGCFACGANSAAVEAAFGVSARRVSALRAKHRLTGDHGDLTCLDEEGHANVR